MKITKSSKEAASFSAMKAVANAGCNVCPCCGETKSWSDYMKEGILNKGVMVGTPNKTWAEGVFHMRNMNGKRFYDVVGGHHSVKVSKKDWIVVEDTHEGIITQEEFDHAQAKLREFVEKDGTSGSRVLGRKVRCGICGHVMYRTDVKEPYFITDVAIISTPIRQSFLTQNNYACRA